MPTQSRVPRVCAYCGAPSPSTKDHIPPKALFAPPRPKDLVSVPACVKCNQQASKDDEYFRNVLALRFDTYDHPEVQKILPLVIRSYTRPEKTPFAASFARSLREVEVRTASGLSLGRTGAFTVRRERLVRVACRITKGLFYTVKSYPVPSTHDTVALPDHAFSDLPQSQRAALIPALLAPLAGSQPVVIGRGAFAYRFAFVEEDPNASVWLLTFYGAFKFLAATAPKQRKLLRRTTRCSGPG